MYYVLFKFHEDIMYGVKYMSKKHEKNVPSAKLFFLP